MSKTYSVHYCNALEYDILEDNESDMTFSEAKSDLLKKLRKDKIVIQQAINEVLIMRKKDCD